MRFTHPLYLLLLIPLLVGLVLSYRHVHGMAKARKRIAFVLRFALVGLLVFALAGPEARRPNEGLCTIFLLDRSDSVSEADKRRAERFVDEAMQKLGRDDLAGVIAFGKSATVDAAPGGRRALGRVLSKVDGSASDLAGAIRLASASFPDGKSRRIVVLSDGNETNGDAAEAASVAATEGIPLDHVVLGLEQRQGEASVVSLETPDEVRADAPFDLRAIVDSNTEATGTLDIDRDGVVIKRVPVRLSPGRNSIVVGQSLKDPGFHRYRATLRLKGDADSRNNVGMGFVAVRGKPRALVLQQNPGKSPLADALRKSGLAVDLGGPGNVPSRPEELQGYDAIFFNDLNAGSLTPAQMKMMQAAVRDSGVGFAMVGGEDSFLPGGYYGTPIADVLPVDLDVRQRKSFPSTSILIIVDCSGSMGAIEDGQPKLRLAAQAAEQTVRLLSPMDRVGVAGSTDGIEFVAPMQPLTDKGKVIEQVRRLQITGGGIFIGPSIEAAEKVIRAEPSKVRHLIVLADGNDSTDWRDAIPRTAGMFSSKITTTVVAIGDGKDVPQLKALAAAGGGRFYLAKRAAQLPAIFTQDAAIMSRSAIEEGAFIPKVAPGEEILRGVADGGLPPLLAYCLTDTRPLSRVGMRTHKDDPLLATWQYGLGTSLAFTSDAQARWASRWVPWEGFTAFWAQAARAISRRATLNEYQVSVRQEGGKGVVEVKAFDRLGNPLAATDATVRVATPSGASREVALSQQAPGTYTGTFEAGELGSYIVTVAEPDPRGGGQRVSSSGFSLPYPPEYRAHRANRPLLERLASTTGGKALVSPIEALRPVPNPGASITELWPLFVLLAALLLPLDVAVRRIALPLAEIFAALLARLRARRAAPATAPVMVDRLHVAKRRATREGEPAEPVSQAPPTRPSSPRAPTPPPPPAATGGTASKGLLDAKRKRRGE